MIKENDAIIMFEVWIDVSPHVLVTTIAVCEYNGFIAVTENLNIVAFK
jgi:hypothetical protein